MPPVPRWTRTVTAVTALVLIPTALVSCGDQEAAPDLERETFIAAYVDLRAEALLSDLQELTDEQRTLVLNEHGVSEEDLIAFTENHGTDVEYMRDLWDEVEERLDALRPVIDEGGELVRPIQRPSDRIGG